MAVKDIFKRVLGVVKSASSGTGERTRTSRRGGRDDAPKGRRSRSGHTVPAPRGDAPAEDIADLHGITISYAPEPGAEPDPGEVVWTWVPYEEDPTQGKDRPVALFGRRGGELVGVALTTKGDHPDQVLVGTGAWDPQGRKSYAKLERIFDVDGAKVRRVGGVLDEKRFDDLVQALRRFYT